MRVILKKEVQNLGEAGDIVNVKPGYGRNYLIPRGLAIPASEGSIKQVEHQQRLAEAIRKQQLEAARAIGAKLSGTSITIRREAGDDDKLFGSVTNRDIADALGAEGVEVDRRTILLEDNIRTLGLFQVPVRVHREVTALVKVYVMKA
ncbi:MAG: 50S ribosomal protein L9 [Deltaproteobacteria bacterium]|nr:MAG: 50S ribosomal protein L9 [Deltaproteobacteria bacterium]